MQPHVSGDRNGPNGKVRSELAARPEDVVARRRGEVLLKHTILKSDHFPGCQNKALSNQLPGAPNFRQVPELPVYGCAIPTVSGLRHVLHALGASNGQRQVLWHNMREEPVLYINGRPFVVREADKPFQNLEYTGIDRSRVEDMERRLKADVLREAADCGNQILIAGETDDFQVVEEWEPVTEANVQTPSEVYQALAEEGYLVDYLRVPVTDEKAPKADDFAVLIARAWAPPSGAALVFNCQMGRGRTTTGMIIASLLYVQAISRPPNNSVAPQPPSWYVSPAELVPQPAAKPPNPDAELKAGNFGAVRSLLRVLASGVESKAMLDSVIDACSAMQNLREAINGYRTRLMREGHEGKRNSLLEVCLEYLERYFMLIAFTAYLSGGSFAPGEARHHSFGQWLDERPELQSVKDRMLRRNPLAAMALHHPSRHLADAMPPTTLGLPDPQLQDERQAAVQATTDNMVAARSGAVLGAHTILKEDHFPGCQSDNVPVLQPGAPNLRAVPGTNVYGVGLPTVAGIRATLAHVGAAPGTQSPTGHEVTAVWHNMREEVCIYINGRPYVLREEERPFKNMQEYTGIDWARLQKMEARLRNDVLREAGAMSGRLLVARELTHGGRQLPGGDMEDDFETIAGPGSVQTPQEVYEQLAAEGYRVKYYRVPLTDGTTPKERDFDEFARHIRAAEPNDPLIFNCQLGGGRTTTGTVIGCLVRSFMADVEPGAAPDIGSVETGSTNGRSTSGRSNGAAAEQQVHELKETTFSAPPKDSAATDGLTSPLSRLQLGDLSHAPSSTLGDDEAALNNMASPRSVMSDEVQGASPPASDDEDEHMCTSTGSASDAPSAAAAPLHPEHTQRRALGQQPATLGNELEVAALKEGEYVAVRRFVRLLERGGDAKAALDELVDRAGALVNLRTAISRYRKPRRRFRFFRPEIQARHTAFKRGSAYLERYCLLIAFTAYLEDCRRRQLSSTFEDWMAARPDLCQARNSILDNPAGALAPVPAYRTPSTMRRIDSLQALSTEQREVLAKRGGAVLSRRSILKTAAPRPADVEANALRVPGIADIRKVKGRKVYTLGEATVDGWRQLLEQLGAGPGGLAHAVVTDVREEMVAYIAGRPYLRRELEMPAAAFHHAGIRAEQLERLEAALAADLAAEAEAWGGKLLLHAEPWAYVPAPSSSGQQQAAAITNGQHSDFASAAAAATCAPHEQKQSGQQVPQQASERAQSAGTPQVVRLHTWHSGQAKRRWQLAVADAITHNTQEHEAHEEADLVAFWQAAHGGGGDIESGVATPKQVFAQLAKEGFQLSAARVPLSRERVPEAADLDTLRAVHTPPPEGKEALHLVVSRTATGSSVRFVAAFAAGYQQWLQKARAAGMDRVASTELPPSDAVREPPPLSAADARAFARHRSAGVMGEYRTIMNLCRVLPDGLDCKTAVDEAIDCCNDIGNLRDDILKCKEAAEAAPPAPIVDAEVLRPAEVAAGQLGRHYLQRYFLLIAFRCYLDANPVQGPGVPTFTQWFAARAELRFLLSGLSLETAL